MGRGALWSAATCRRFLPAEAQRRRVERGDMSPRSQPSFFPPPDVPVRAPPRALRYDSKPNQPPPNQTPRDERPPEEFPYFPVSRNSCEFVKFVSPLFAASLKKQETGGPWS
jgi:hypothetical protein